MELVAAGQSACSVVDTLASKKGQRCHQLRKLLKDAQNDDDGTDSSDDGSSDSDDDYHFVSLRAPRMASTNGDGKVISAPLPQPKPSSVNVDRLEVDSSAGDRFDSPLRSHPSVHPCDEVDEVSCEVRKPYSVQPGGGKTRTKVCVKPKQMHAQKQKLKVNGPKKPKKSKQKLQYDHTKTNSGICSIANCSSRARSHHGKLFTYSVVGSHRKVNLCRKHKAKT